MTTQITQSKVEAIVPGPGSYNIPSTLRVQQSLSKQSNEKRFKPYETVVPGPGQYNTLSASNIQGPKALILSRTKQQQPDKIPGPGSYQPNFGKVMKSQSGYQLPKGERSSPTDKTKKIVPGPGTYETAKSTLLDEKHAIVFGPERKIKLAYENNVPGPGQYNTINTSVVLDNAPKPVFGKGGRSQSYNTLTPGPGTYKYSDNFETNNKKGFSISFRHNQREPGQKKKLPGPGAYHLDQIDKIKFKSTSGFSIPKSPRLKIDNERQLLSIPGPQKYNIPLTAFEHKSYKVGKSSRRGLESNSQVPGPGSYDIKNLEEMPKFSMPKSSMSWIKSNNIPGPGNYNPKIVANTQYQAIGINKDNRRPFYDEKKFVPGPGQYTLTEMVNKKGGFSVGNQKRPDLGQSREKKPGPGEYNVVSKLKGAKEA